MATIEREQVPTAEERCPLCHGPLYRISLVDGTLESLDHGECLLLSQAA